MKSYTNLEQSRKLAEILPIESADMFYRDSNSDDVKLMWEHVAPKVTTPCWSLAALLNTLPISIDGRHCLALINSNPSGEIDWLCCYEDDNGNLLTGCYGDNQVDACVEMIIMLHELKLL